jgi:hypothetical protein
MIKKMSEKKVKKKERKERRKKEQETSPLQPPQFAAELHFNSILCDGCFYYGFVSTLMGHAPPACINATCKGVRYRRFSILFFSSLVGILSLSAL